VDGFSLYFKWLNALAQQTPRIGASNIHHLHHLAAFPG
jgi:hypothetical protein